MKIKEKIIYISYDGILDPLGQSQVLKYISKSKYSNKIILLSFEKKNRFNNIDNFTKVNDIILNSGIDWHYYYYNNNLWFFSKIFDLFKINLFVIKNLIIYNIKIIHCRSYFPIFAVNLLKLFSNFKLIFDMRGFWIDERYEWGIWKYNYLIYKFLKWIEKKLIIYSNKIIVLNNDAEKELITKYKIIKDNIYVIPTCADETQFYISTKKYWINTLNICHLGTISTRYDIDFTIKFYIKLNKHIPSKILFINNNEIDYIKFKCTEYKLNEYNYEIKSIEHFNIQNQINMFDFLIFFSRKGYFTKGFFPTKIAESLLSGVPIISNSINNHLDELIDKNKIGLKIENLSEKNINEFLNKINIYKKNLVPNNLRLFAIKNLSIEFAISKYNNIYDKLIN